MPKQKTNREEILETAFEVFKKKGYHQTTISDLATACGLEKPHLYYYFKSKKNIMEEVLKHARMRMNEWVFSKAYNTAYSPEQRFHKMLDNMKTIHQRHFDGCIMGNTVLESANTEPDLLQYVQDYFSDLKKAFVHVLSHELPAEEAEKHTEAFLREIQGAMIFMRLYRQTDYLGDVMERMKRLMPTTSTASLM